ncbi:uncharacterized protein LOC135373211 isoform X2 [Ornithodoros turicata]|uniref:uncharacterized protein LOC135373183 isoform X2 n=1 Tax=Ornithodoros turicata TaxID=34597 RepID=UPI003138F8EE
MKGTDMLGENSTLPSIHQTWTLVRNQKKKRKIQKRIRYEDEDSQYSPPAPPLNFPRASACHSPDVGAPGEDDATLSTTSNTIISNYDLVHGSPFPQVSRQCTRLQQQPTPAVKKVISPSDFQREVLTRLTALRLLVQQQTELLTVLSTKYTKECAIQEQDSILKERFENIAPLSASTSL